MLTQRPCHYHRLVGSSPADTALRQAAVAAAWGPASQRSLQLGVRNPHHRTEMRRSRASQCRAAGPCCSALSRGGSLGASPAEAVREGLLLPCCRPGGAQPQVPRATRRRRSSWPHFMVRPSLLSCAASAEGRKADGLRGEGQLGPAVQVQAAGGADMNTATGGEESLGRGRGAAGDQAVGQATDEVVRCPSSA